MLLLFQQLQRLSQNLIVFTYSKINDCGIHKEHTKRLSSCCKSISLYFSSIFDKHLYILVKLKFYWLHRTEKIHSFFFLSLLWFIPYPLPAIKKKKKTLYTGVNVFSRKVLVGDTTFTSPTGDGITIFHGHLSLLFATQRQYLHFSVMLRPWVLVRTRESNLGLPLCSQLAYWLN